MKRADGPRSILAAMRARWSPRVLVALLALVQAARAGERDVRQLLDGVKTLGTTGIPGRISVFGADADPVLLGEAGDGLRAPVVAAGSAGGARLVAFAHNGWFGTALDRGDGWKLLENALRWASKRTRGKVRVGVLGGDEFVKQLVQRGFDAEVVGGLERLEKTPPIDVLCGGLRDWNADELARLERWLKAGGAIVGGVTPWGWAQLNPGKDLVRDLVANRIAAPFGLAWADGTTAPGKDERFAAGDPLAPWCHAGAALDALFAKAAPPGFGEREMAQAAWTVAQALRWAPEDERAFRGRVLKAFGSRAAVVPTAAAPLRRDRVLERVQLEIAVDEGLRASATRVRAHPAAESFPGAVPASAPRVVRDLALDLAVPRWRSTGLYAAPGETVEVSIPAAAVGRRLRVRIGAHSDDISGSDAWSRAPRVTREDPIDAERVQVASPFGGLVYLVVPDGAPAETVAVKLRNVVEAPRFVLGQTDPAAWRQRIRDLPGPWAELETRSIVLTVPAAAVRGIDDPTEILTTWNKAMDAAADLAGIERERRSPERFVCDVQISAGYMHSGYPVMAHLDAAEFVTRPDRLRENAWGPFHEIGHNHQQGAWTFDGTGEVTNNVFTLYLYEQACGKAITDDERFTAAARTQRWKGQKDAKDAFERWKSDPFLGLLVYVDVQQGFGWDVYKRVFREYRAMKDAERPQSDDQKRDEWLVRLSRACGKDLGPLFTSWGVKTSPEARASLSDLPVWLPEGRL
jgi:hypothetical protein